MPIYEYKCVECGKVFEVMQKFSDEPVKECVSCSGKVEKLISQSSFVLKGSGWYSTDYAGSKDTKSEAKPECATCPSACPAQG